ncbi:hypothetical protein R1sor_000075 [Riccia sorocarpa]|uniref:Uncharacterized protein n=1 Tax=Riccia sorocarpa TaxID=122646 RepID=A0ABD3GS47_9MARC
MLESAETGVGVNWAYIITERLRTELRKLKLARKDEVYRCEAGPQLTVLAEYLATERQEGQKKGGKQAGNPVNKPPLKATEKKKKEEPLRTLVKKSDKKPVTPAKKTKADTKKVGESPSQRTRAAKRKLADNSQDGRRNQRRKVQIETKESEDQEVTEETEDPEETELSDSESGETLPSGTDKTSESSEESSGESEEDEQEATPPYRAPANHSINSNDDTGGPPGFAPLLQALGEAGELKGSESIPDVSLPTDSSSNPDHDKQKRRKGGRKAEVGVTMARRQAQGSERLRKRLKRREEPKKTLLGDPARHVNAQTPDAVNTEPVRKKSNLLEAIARASNLIQPRPIDVFKDDQPDLRVKSVVNNALEKTVIEKVSANIPLPVAFQQVVAEIKGTEQTTQTLATPAQNQLAATAVETATLPTVSQSCPVITSQATIQLTTPEVKPLPPIVTYTGLMNQVEMKQLQPVITAVGTVCAVESQPDNGKELATEEGRPDENPVECGVYRKEFTHEIAELCTEGPSLVQLPARFEPMGDPLRPWEYVAAHAKAPSLHLNEVIRNDIDQNLVPTREDLFELIKERVEQRKKDQEELFNRVFARNPVPRPGQLNPVSMPPSFFEQVGFLSSLQSRGYLDWSSTPLTTCHTHTRKQMRDQLDELARCQHRFNCQFTRNIETGVLLEIMYGLLDKADPTGKYFIEYEKKVYEMRKQLDRDKEFWFRSRRTDMGHAELRRQFFADSGGPSDPRHTGDRGGSQEERGASGPSSSHAGPTPPDSPGKSK